MYKVKAFKIKLYIFAFLATRERLRKKIAAKKQGILEDNAKRAQIVDEMKKERAMYENKLMSVETAVSNLDTVKALEEEIGKTENEIYEIKKNVEKAEKIHITRNKEIFYERKAEIQGLLRQFRQEEFKLDYSNTQKTKLCKTLVKKKLVETDRKYKEFARDLELPERNLQKEVNRLMLKKKKLVNRLEMMQEQEEMLKKKAEHLKSRHDKSKNGNDEDSIHSSQNTIIASEYEYEDKEIDEFPDDDTIFAELFADAEGKNRVFSVLL